MLQKLCLPSLLPQSLVGTSSTSSDLSLSALWVGATANTRKSFKTPCSAQLPLSAPRPRPYRCYDPGPPSSGPRSTTGYANSAGIPKPAGGIHTIIVWCGVSNRNALVMQSSLARCKAQRASLLMYQLCGIISVCGLTVKLCDMQVCMFTGVHVSKNGVCVCRTSTAHTQPLTHIGMVTSRPMGFVSQDGLLAGL